MQQFLSVALPVLATVTTNAATLPFVNYKMQGPPPVLELIKNYNPVEEQKTATKEVAPEKPKEIRL
ncbi:MAG: hypothetical protein ACO3CQ_08225, partial [Candidatus Nanopelagicaceae bacterium]